MARISKGRGRVFRRRPKRLMPRLKRAESGLKKLNSLVETKHVDFSVQSATTSGVAVNKLSATGTALTTTVGVVNTNAAPLTNLSVGNTDSNRVGNEIKLTTLTMNLFLDFQGSGSNSVPVRLLLIKVKNWNGSTTMDLQDYLKYGDTSGTTNVAAPIALGYNWDKRDNFRIIWDKTFVLYNQNAGDRLPSAKGIQKTVKLGFKVKYNGNGTGPASVQRNQLLFVALQSTAGSIDFVTLRGGMRLKYRDA